MPSRVEALRLQGSTLPWRGNTRKTQLFFSLFRSKCARRGARAPAAVAGARTPRTRTCARTPRTRTCARVGGRGGGHGHGARARASQLSLSLSLHYPLLCLLQQQAACGPELPRRGRGPSSTRASPRASWPGGTTTWAHPRAARASWAAAACARRGHAHEAQAEGAPDSAPAWSDLALSLKAGRPA